MSSLIILFAVFVLQQHSYFIEQGILILVEASSLVPIFFHQFLLFFKRKILQFQTAMLKVSRESRNDNVFGCITVFSLFTILV